MWPFFCYHYDLSLFIFLFIILFGFLTRVLTHISSYHLLFLHLVFFPFFFTLILRFYHSSLILLLFPVPIIYNDVSWTGENWTRREKRDGRTERNGKRER